MFLAKTFADRNAVQMGKLTRKTWRISISRLFWMLRSVLLSVIKPSRSIKRIGLHISVSVFGRFECSVCILFISYGNTTLSWTCWTLNTVVEGLAMSLNHSAHQDWTSARIQTLNVRSRAWGSSFSSEELKGSLVSLMLLLLTWQDRNEWSS